MSLKIVRVLLLCAGLQAGEIGQDRNEEIVSSLQAIVFASYQQDIESAIKLGTAVTVDVPLLNDHPEFLEKISEKYLGIPFNLAVLEAIQQEVSHFYVSQKQPLVRISVPEQEITSGVLCLIVEETKTGTIEISGNRYFSSKQLCKEIRTSPGMPIDLESLASDISWINQNPFRQADAVLKAGTESQYTDVEIIVKDRFPCRFYAGGDDTGTKTTSLYRIFAGFNAGNLFQHDNQISYQYTCAPNPSRFFAHTGEYIAPLPWRHYLRLFGAFSKTRPDFQNSLMKMNAYSWQANLRYEIPFLGTRGALQHRVSLGLDFKQTNNDLQFGGVDVLNHNIDIADIRICYNLGFERSCFRSAFELALIFSPGGITSSNTTHAFERLRPYAHSAYGIIEGDWSASYFFNPRGWAFTWDMWGQGTTTNLMPSEQFLLGGYNTVRGFQQNQVTVDNGLGASFEVHSPTWSFFKSGKAPLDALYFLGFIDYGWGMDHKLSAGEKPTVHILGAGPGLRYSLGHYLSARLDCGFPLNKSPYSPHLQQRWYFGIVASY